MKQVARVLLYDVVLATVHIGVDAYLIYSYLRDGEEWWAAATISAVCLPGLLGRIFRSVCLYWSCKVSK